MRHLFRWRWIVLATIAAIAAGALLMGRRAHPSITDLLGYAPSDIRVIEPRLSGGLPWAPLADAKHRRDARDKLLDATAGIVSRASEIDEPGASRLTAIAQLLTGGGSKGLAALQAIPETQRDAAWWSDFAAAHYVVAVESDSPDQLIRALAAVDCALRFDAAMPDALFNRALILERFHLRASAANAWKRYLAAEPDGGWAAEARGHLAAISGREESFEAAVERLYPRLQVGDRAAAEELLHIDAGDARYFAECEGLSRWGEARLAGDSAAAARRLTAARSIASALSATEHEGLLADSIAAIDGASARELDSLARGHVGFRDGRRVSKERRPTEAEKILSAAARELAAGGSPMAAEVRFFTGVEIFEQNRVDEAQSVFVGLATNVPARYAALSGYLAWLRASCLMARAQLGGSIRYLSIAVDTFERLGESSNAAFLHDIMAQVFDAARDRLRARHHRLLALRQLGKSNSFRLEHAVFGMVYDAAQRKDWPAARSFLDVEMEIAQAVRDPELRVNVLLRRALVHSRLGEAALADLDLRGATAILASVVDPALKDKLQVDRDATASLVASSPETAIRLLSGVLQFHATKGWRMLMPDLYLRRGRMHAALGDRRRAAADFEEGIAEIERDRESLPAGESRWGVLDAADELFEEAIDAAVRDDPPLAFRYAERARARTLSDALPDGGKALDVAEIAADTAVVEYAVLPHKVVIFVVTQDGVYREVKEVGREEVASLLERFGAEMRSGDWSKATGIARRIHDLLVAPIQFVVASRRQIVFVPDAATSSVPFSALVDSATNRPLIESHIVSVSPSSRMYVAARERQQQRRRESVLIFDDPANMNLPELSMAAAEAKAVYLQYPRALRFSGHAATASAFLAEAPRFDVVHFAGHGFWGDDLAALTLADNDGAAGNLDAAMISHLRLPRTSVVVLAACGSARGPLRTEGQLSVAYAFLHAGAPAVVATLWPISDAESVAFFPRLHRYLAQGLPVAEALRQAQLDVLHDANSVKSTLWASVQTIGY
jgi:CHAT domain-containing protein